jgi:ATP-dependent DNA helicase RecQ
MAPPRAVGDVLQSVFGFSQLKPGQQAVIDHLLAGRSALAIFPTGGGKSLCYQLPALLLEGVTVVISPLLALMRDQLEFLHAHGIAAGRLDSTQTPEQSRAVLADLQAGRLRLLYLSPERFATDRFQATLRRLPVALLAVDEAHCISEWGHNFRPDYLKIARLTAAARIPRILALTATATPAVANDIARGFNISPAAVVRTGLYRSNLHLQISPCPDQQRLDLLTRRLQTQPRGATIVYTTTQKQAEEVAEHLAKLHLPAKAYHAGLDIDIRTAVQEWFMAETEAIVCATIAFGMGIDKADIRAVYHYNLPKSVENYLQEIGRAGRDGQPSHCEMLACRDDCIVLENFVYGDTPTTEAVSGCVTEVLSQGPQFDISTYELSGRHDMKLVVIETLLTYLELDNILAATGMFYTEYRFQPVRSSAEILRGFNAPRAEFLRRVFRQAVPSGAWFRLVPAQVAQALNEPRERIVSAIHYLADQGELVLQPTGVRQGYRRLVEAADVQMLSLQLTERFATRERRDLDRLGQVLEYATHAGCRTRWLLQYAGDRDRPDCGHCTWCRGNRKLTLPAVAVPLLGRPDADVVAKLRSEDHAALAVPRQMTRFLCGLSAPAVSRAKLMRHNEFGRLRQVPFADVSEFVERHWQTRATVAATRARKTRAGE